MGGTDFTDSGIPAVDMNDTFDRVAPGVILPDQGSSVFIYTGSGFDASGGAGSNDHTFQITAAELRNATFIILQMTVHMEAVSAAVGLQVQRQETGGGGFADVLAADSWFSDQDVNIDQVTLTTAVPIILTAGEKTNGIDIKILTTTGGANTSITNLFTWLEMKI